MKRIYVINKTHLDVGFTDLAYNTLKRYTEEYIPNAITLAEELEKEGEQFTWTTGSFIVKYFLENQNEENIKRLENAIAKGYIRWHAIPLTFNSELLSQELAEYMLSISKDLDAKYGYTTTSAKMTDVPGHTKGLIKYLYKNNVKFLHIGVNGVSPIPNVPEMFLWKDGDAEVIVSYSNDYGGVIEVPFIEEKMSFMHTHDNSGPGTIERVRDFISETKAKYPDYQIISSSMDEFADILWEQRDKLPVVEEEIGDNWIHGTMCDPELVRKYKILTDYIKENEISPEAMFQALLIPEHTWGMDIKRYFSDYKNYEKADFQKARALDNITDEDLAGYDIVREETLEEMQYTSFEWTDRSYKLFESSWTEKRDNIDKTFAKLNANVAQKLNQAAIIPSFELFNEKIEPGQIVNINDYSVRVDIDGSLNLVQKDGVTYFDVNNKCGVFNYAVCDVNDYDNLRNNYLRHANWWRIDFLKPGMELVIPTPQHQNFQPIVKDISINGNKLNISVIVSVVAITEYGAPREIIYSYTFDETITFEATLKNKDAIRYAEIISFNINPMINNHARLKMAKLGSEISPLDVVGSASKMQHIVEKITYDATDRNFTITPKTSPLVSFGSYNNLSYKHDYLPTVNNMYFILLNTTWGTNFRMWYEEDIYTKFEIKLGK